MKIDHTWYQRPAHVPEHESAGGIVVRIANGKIYFACAGETGLTAYVLPKGRGDALGDIGDPWVFPGLEHLVKAIPFT